MSVTISFVIPCYKGEATIGSVINEIIEKVSERKEYECEIICVDDCSPDGTLQTLRNYANADSRVKVVALGRNGGKHAALLAGFSYVAGEFVVVLDDDGECPVDRLWDLIDPLYNGWDMTIANYQHRSVGHIKKLFSAANNELYHLLFNKPKDITFANFSARKRFICEYSTRYDGPFPYLEGITLQITRNIMPVPMDSRKRLSGRSGFTFGKGLELTVNGCTSYSLKPLRASLLFAAISVVLAVVFYFAAGLFEGTSMLMFSLLFLSMGVVGEYAGRAYLRTNNIPQYVVRETLNIDDDYHAQTR